MRKIGLITLIMLAASAVGATTLNVPVPYATIQSAIDASISGDVIEIACGEYTEALTIDKSGITLRGASLDPICVTVNADGAIRALYLNGSTTPLTGLVFEGITFTGATRQAAALYHSAANFTSCAFRDVTTSGQLGPGVYMRYAETDVTFTDCFFLNNSTDVSGGGVYATSTPPPTFINCTFFGNSADKGGGIYLWSVASAEFTDCTFSDNSGSSEIYPAAAIGGDDMDITLTRCILTFSTDGQAVDLTGVSSVTATCCDIYGNEGGDYVEDLVGQNGVNGNFSLDPQFCGEAGIYNLELQTDSPCVSANHPAGGGTCPTIGALPVGCLATATKATTWSVVKGLY